MLIKIDNKKRGNTKPQETQIHRMLHFCSIWLVAFNPLWEVKVLMAPATEEGKLHVFDVLYILCILEANLLSSN